MFVFTIAGVVLPKGDPGPPGEPGEEGLRGPKGCIGTNGTRGDPGLKGIKGELGMTVLHLTTLNFRGTVIVTLCRCRYEWFPW